MGIDLSGSENYLPHTNIFFGQIKFIYQAILLVYNLTDNYTYEDLRNK